MSENPGDKVLLITGAARRLGAACARQMHASGWKVIIHCRHTVDDAKALANELNQKRPDSACVLQADLSDDEAVENLAREALAQWQRLDALVNNASAFYPTPVGEITAAHWDDLMASNLKAPLFLSQALAPELKKRGGAIINIADIHGRQPLKQHTVYSIAKAGNIMLTKSLAKELAPQVRVNGIAPGAMLWPEGDAELDEGSKQKIIERIALGRTGGPDDIAGTLQFLLESATYISGAVIAVDGGRSLGA